MKKIALTSLLAVFAVSGAHAANVIDGNPLYLPGAHHFYSVSSLGSHSQTGRAWTLAEEFGYGITDKLAIELEADLSEHAAFDDYAWNNLSLGLTYRALDMGAWKTDIVLGYAAGDAGLSYLANGREVGALAGHMHGKTKWFDKDATYYTWTAGVRGGYVASNWTVAAHALFNYFGEESFKWNADAGERGVHFVALGLDAQYVICPHFSVLAGVEYKGVLDKEYQGRPGDKVENAGLWTGMLGANYNIDATKYVGLYVSADMDHQGGAKHDEWDVENGFGFGAKFGIDF